MSTLHAGDVCKLEHGAENIHCSICRKLQEVNLLTWQLERKPLETKNLHFKDRKGLNSDAQVHIFFILCGLLNTPGVNLFSFCTVVEDLLE